MDKVIKVNIGNMAFTLSEAAHERLSVYLESLSDYYEGNPNRNEILAGIEERVAELLVEKGIEKDMVVGIATIDEIISLLGRPEDFGDGNAPAPDYPKNRKKRLYRDMANAKMGGVCSGLGAYFSIDPVIIRVIWAVVVFIGVALFFAEDEGYIWISIVAAVLYFIAQKSMPEAKTLDDKVKMHGSAYNVKDIEDNVSKGNDMGPAPRSSKPRGSGFVRVLGIIVGVLLFIIGLSGGLAVLLSLLGVGAFNILSPYGLSDILSMFIGLPGWASGLFTVLIILVCGLPFIGMLYGGVMMCFNLRAPKWKPGLVIFLLWVLSVACLAVLGLVNYNSFSSLETRRVTEKIMPSDTLYVEFEGFEQWQGGHVGIDATKRGYELCFMLKEGKERTMVFYPEVEISRSDSREDFSIGFSENYLVKDFMFGDLGFNESNKYWRMEGNTLILSPIVFRDLSETKVLSRDVWLYVEDSTTVIVKEPVYHQFESRYEYYSSRFMENIMDL